MIVPSPTRARMYHRKPRTFLISPSLLTLQSVDANRPAQASRPASGVIVAFRRSIASCLVRSAAPGMCLLRVAASPAHLSSGGPAPARMAPVRRGKVDRGEAAALVALRDRIERVLLLQDFRRVVFGVMDGPVAEAFGAFIAP